MNLNISVHYKNLEPFNEIETIMLMKSKLKSRGQTIRNDSSAEKPFLFAGGKNIRKAPNNTPIHYSIGEYFRIEIIFT